VRAAFGLRSLVCALAALWAAVIFAASLAATTTLLGGSPDVVCVVVVSIALLRGPEAGALAGFCAGLGVDALTWQPLGLAALVYCLVGYGSGRIGEQLPDRAPVSPLFVIAIASLVARCGLVLLGFLLGSDLAVPAGATLGMIPSAALDVLIAIPLYPLLRRGLRRPPPPVVPLPALTPTPTETDDVPAVVA
jgi:rod shape-determining protein MreD